MQPEMDDFLEYQDFNRVTARCRFRTYQTPVGLVVVLSELGDNHSASVTNSLDAVLKASCQRLEIKHDEAIFIEHYDISSYGGGRNNTATFARMSPEGFHPNKHKWQYMPFNLVRDLLGPEIIGDAVEEFPPA